MDMLKHDPMYDEQSTKLADAPNSLPSWNREALALTIQTIDRCSYDEAEIQIDALVTAFRSST